MNMPDLGLLTLGNSSFEEIRKAGSIYVDKSDLIYSIIRSTKRVSTPVFMSRPRRFGKSLVSSTFESWFRHGRTFFKGLKLEEEAEDEDVPCLVISLSFASFADPQSDLLSELGEALKYALANADNLPANIDIGAYQDKEVYKLLRRVLNSAAERSVVMIIDEYDSPLIHRVGYPQKYKRATEIYTAFFNTVKEHFSTKFRFLFLTGIARFSHTSIFSGFNTLWDLSYTEKYSALYGFTKEELVHYYLPYLEYYAGLNGLSFEETLNDFIRRYDGYSFDPYSNDTLVFNPWSVLFVFFNLEVAPTRPLLSYWTGSGNLSSLEDRFLNFHFQDQDMQLVLHEICRMMSAAPIDPESLITSQNYLHQDLMLLLVQTGYLTLRHREDALYLVIPNEEIRSAFAKNLLSRYPNLLTSDYSSRLLSLGAKAVIRALQTKDATALKEAFNTILNCIGPASRKALFSHEVAVRDFLFANLTSLGIEAYKEVEGTLGYCDLLLFFTGQNGLRESAVFEFKRLPADKRQSADDYAAARAADHPSSSSATPDNAGTAADASSSAVVHAIAAAEAASAVPSSFSPDAASAVANSPCRLASLTKEQRLDRLEAEARAQLRERRYHKVAGVGVTAAGYAAVIDSSSFEIVRLSLIEEMTFREQ